MSQYNQFNQNQSQHQNHHQGQNQHGMPPLQTHNHHVQGQHSAYSPQPYQQQSQSQSPNAMSPTSAGGIPPAKRQRLSPGPASPAYSSHYSTSPYAATSPYATSPPAQYLARPESPAMSPPMHSFNQPQPYPYQNNMDQRPQQPGSLMPPPKVPYSKTQDNTELEKGNPKEGGVDGISDVLTGSGIDLRAEEEAMFLNVRSFNSQASGSTLSPHGSFSQWGQPQQAGAFQGTGPINHAVTEEQQQQEMLRKHEQAARILNEAAATPLNDPFTMANALRLRMGKRAYEQGITLNVEGLFDKIPDTPREVTRTTLAGSNGESIVGLQANSILNHGAPLVEMLSLVSLATQERIRTIVEDAFALSQGRQNTSAGLVPPCLADIAIASGRAESVAKTVLPANLSKTTWEAAPDSAVSPLTTTASKHLPDAKPSFNANENSKGNSQIGRLPTPPSEAPTTPRSTIQFKTNHITACLKRKMEEDERFEKQRLDRRRKRAQGLSATPADTPLIAPVADPAKLSKKEKEREKKLSNTEDALHSKANETANLAFGKKKKYAWMTGGGGPSGASTPRLNTAVGANSGTATPAAATATDRNLLARKRKFLGGDIETGDSGKNIQLRDLIHVLEHDGRDRKTLVSIISRMRSDKEDEKKIQDRPSNPVPPAR